MFWRLNRPNGTGVSPIRGEIWKIAAFKALRSSGSFSFPWIFWFLTSKGLSIADAFMLEAICQGSMLLTKLPAGRLADRWGRKKTMVVGAVGVFLVGVLYPITETFAQFVTLEVLWGAACGLAMGADEAQLRDSLEASGVTQHEQNRIWGRLNFVESAFACIGSLTGGLLGIIDWRIPFAVAALGFGAMVLIGLTVREAPRQLRPGERVWTAWAVVRYCLRENAEVAWVIRFIAVFGATAFAGFWLLQPVLKLSGVSDEVKAGLFAIIPLVRGLGSIQALRLVDRFGLYGACRCNVVLLSGGLVLSSAFPGVGGALLFVPVVFAAGAAHTAASNALAAGVEASFRATAVAVSSFVGQAATALLLLITGFAASDGGELRALFGLGILAVLTGLFFLSRRPPG